ncbi:hypothetical protein L596_006286 [Steinernema carpocapsae]|uniref:Uncharacterized protein n=1 Tax=Steinernema carpocapsae TaxID=34508 RepID=A0A4V6I8W8_STECR|nr:hypothetical protein L596_006286 [Steinernema carpocapsae]
MHFLIDYHNKYLWHWRILCAIWVLFALCTAILHFLVLTCPAWIGDGQGSYFGLYNYCLEEDCPWNPFEVRLLSTQFSVAFFLVLLANVFNVLAIISAMLLVLLRDRIVVLTCSWLHLFSFLAMLASCIVYPSGWDHPRVREVCDSEQYRLSLCEVKWAYAMAFVLVIDEFVLSTLGFILACKQPPTIPEIHIDYKVPLQEETKRAQKKSSRKQPAGESKPLGLRRIPIERIPV